MMRTVKFTKGHGTGNDFVILPDPDGQLTLTPRLVAAICDRRRGVGADGVLRVVRAAKHPDGAGLAGEAEWFMDYWNADGSLAEMCGNGVRVFVRYLIDTGLATVDAGLPAAANGAEADGARADGTLAEAAAAGAATLPVATRAGLVCAVVAGQQISVRMRRPRVYGTSVATLGELSLPGVAVDCGNPHLVCALPPGLELAALDLTRPPGVDAAIFPTGVNVEFTTVVEPPAAGGVGPAHSPKAAPAERHVRMRVHERGSGETLSCGTGACAVAAVALRDAGRTTGTVVVEVPGGRLSVAVDETACWLTGPAVLVATGEIDPGSLVASDVHGDGPDAHGDT